MKLKIVNKSSNPLPEYATLYSSGMDLRAFLTDDFKKANGVEGESFFLQPMQRKLIPTGIYMEIPIGFEGQVRPRSGIAFKNGVTVLNTPGTIDADYRGEVSVILINLSSEPFEIKNGERIAQIVFSKVEKMEPEKVEILEDTIRGAGGFGHTGK